MLRVKDRGLCRCCYSHKLYYNNYYLTNSGLPYGVVANGVTGRTDGRCPTPAGLAPGWWGPEGRWPGVGWPGESARWSPATRPSLQPLCAGPSAVLPRSARGGRKRVQVSQRAHLESSGVVEYVAGAGCEWEVRRLPFRVVGVVMNGGRLLGVLRPASSWPSALVTGPALR